MAAKSSASIGGERVSNAIRGASTASASARGNRVIDGMAEGLQSLGKGVGDASQSLYIEAKKKADADNNLMIQKTLAGAETNGRRILDETAREVGAGAPGFQKTFEDRFESFSQTLGEGIENDDAKAELQSRLFSLKADLQGKADTYAMQEKDRWRMQQFGETSDAEAIRLSGMGYDEIDRETEKAVGRSVDTLASLGLLPDDAAKMKESARKILTDAANKRKADIDPDRFLAEQGTARLPEARLTDKSLPRGVRNFNPGNLRASKSKWMGEDGQDDEGYIQFNTPENGLRAMAVNLANQKRLHKIDNVQDLISKYAPASENDTSAYTNQVAAALGVSPTAKIDLTNPETLAKIMPVMIKIENGSMPYRAESIGWAATAAVDKDKAGAAPEGARVDGGALTASSAFNLGRYDEQRQWMNYAEARQRENITKKNALITQGRQAIGTIKERMDRGETIPVQEMQAVQSVVDTAADPMLSQEFATRQQLVQDQQQLWNMTPVQLRQYTDSTLRPAVVQEGATVLESERLQMAEKTLSAMGTKAQTDPLALAARRGVPITPLNFADPNTARARLVEAKTVAQEYGVPVANAIYTQEEVAQWQSSFANSSPDSIINTGRVMFEGFGGNFGDAMQPLAKANPAIAYAMGMANMVPGTEGTARDIIVGAQLLAKGEKLQTADGQPWQDSPEYMNMFYSDAAYYQAKSAAQAYIMGRRGYSIDSSPLTPETALDAVIGPRLQVPARGGKSEVIGPAGVTQEQFTAWFKTLSTPEGIKRSAVHREEADAPMGPQREPLLPQFAKTQLSDLTKVPQLTFQTYGPNQYVVKGPDGLPLKGSGPGGLFILRYQGQ